MNYKIKTLLLISGLLLSACSGGGGETTSENLGDPSQGQSGSSNLGGNGSDNENDNSDNNDTKIKILAMYSNTAREQYGENDVKARIDHLNYIANKVNSNSKVNLKYEIVEYKEYQTDDTLSMEEKLNAAIASNELANYREIVKADIVSLFEPVSGDIQQPTLCGLGVINTEMIKEVSFSIVALNCVDFVLAHELGHNLGLAHSHKQNQTGIYPYSYGYGVDNSFVTVMAYQQMFNTTKTELLYSNPNINCEGLPCGDEENAFSQKSVLETKNTVANFYP